MTAKPILHNGFKINEGVTVRSRIERIFFTEVYLLSDGRILYLFYKINAHEIPDRSRGYDLTDIYCMNNKYLGLFVDEHSHEVLAKIVKDITIRSGFDCVAGMKELKNVLIHDVIYPLSQPEKYKRFRLSIPNGILLYGPPGCGKTFIVKKLSEELEYNFVELCPSSIATPYVHGAVSNIRKVFEMAKSQSPSIIFIDEIEGLLPRREDLSSNADVKKEEINEFLIQLNNASENKILVVGATNRPHMIDLAILDQEGWTKGLNVAPPDHEARKEMFKICLFGRPYDENINFVKLADMTEHFASSDIELIVTESARTAVFEDRDLITEEMIVDILHQFSPSISVSDIEYFRQFDNLKRL